MVECDYKGLAREIVASGISLAETFDDWTRLGLALADLGEEGRAIYHAISAVSDKYNESETDKKFSRCLRSPRRIGIATFVYMARQAGVDVSKFYRQGGAVSRDFTPIKVQPRPVKPTAYYPIPFEEYQPLISADSVFVKWLRTWSDDIGVEVAIDFYKLGADSKKRVIFPRIDKVGRVWDGKILKYQTDGHRAPKGEGTDWLIAQRRRDGLVPDDYVSPKILFGLHLLWDVGCRLRTVIVVEACKSAVVGHLCVPCFLWMATGGEQCDMAMMLRPVVKEGYNIILLPDVGKYKSWLEKAQAAKETFESEGLHPVIDVDDMMEQRATDDERRRGIDVADWFVANLSKGNV